MSNLFLSWPKTLDNLLEGIDLNNLEAESLMEAWLSEDLQPVQTGAFLAALRAKGVNGSELASMAKVLREACKFPFSVPEMDLVDTCGTGGDGADTFNISTAVAFVSASLGAKVAKHGNRSASGKVGSADVLEGLGVNLNSPIELVLEALNQKNVTFLFAPVWHSSLVNLAPLRKNLGVRTVFNQLGPLVNPFRPNFQVLGVAKPSLLDPMAEALLKIGLKRAVVVFGAGGLDEASLEGINQARFIENKEIISAQINVTDLGLSVASNDELKGGDLEKNKQILTSLLRGKGTKPQREVVALNTALVLWAFGIESDIKKGVNKALACLDNEDAWNKLNELKQVLSKENTN